MGLFDKKFCDFCGGKIGLLGNRKLSDGNMCKDCASGITPHLVGRKTYSVSDMKEHLEQRAENKQRLDGFEATRTLGIGTKIHIDDTNGLLLITSSRKYKDENPDVLDFSQVTGCVLDITENKREQKKDGPDGKKESYNPPRYDFLYDFYITVNFNHKWFDQIKFKVNSSTIEGRTAIEYRDTERQAKEIQQIMQNLHTQIRENATESAKPKMSVNCPACGASTIPDKSGCCEYCGSAIGA